MFHDSYAAGGHGLVYYWIPNTPIADKRGQWAWVDRADNLLVIHATGTAVRDRSQAMVGGQEAARVRLGSAWEYERDNQYVTIPRTQNALVVILPDGRWQQFPLQRGQAAGLFRTLMNRNERSGSFT